MRSGRPSGQHRGAHDDQIETAARSLRRGYAGILPLLETLHFSTFCIHHSLNEEALRWYLRQHCASGQLSGSSGEWFEAGSRPRLIHEA